MITIKLLDARRGLNLKCRELFGNERIAEEIYRYLCEGIEECENAEPERKTGKWIMHENRSSWYCSECNADDYYAYRWDYDTGEYEFQDNYCPNCGADMRQEGAE